jgi:hypothetical protein
VSGTLDEPDADADVLGPPEPPIPDASWAWTILDIAPTEDETEIRRAYARRLKTIDPDNDAPAFIELREARNLVLYVAFRKAAAAAQAEAPEPAAASETAVAQPEPVQGRPEPAPPEPMASRRESGGPPAEATTFQAEPPSPAPPEIDPALFQRIEQMLFGDAPYDPDELRETATALFAHPALDRITLAESVENWAVQVILKSSPRSDPMLDPAIARFGWAENLHHWQRPRVLDWILERRRDAEFERELVAVQPRYVDVLAALRTPGLLPPEKPDWATADDVNALLVFARQHYPTTVAVCDPDVVAGWDQWLRNAPAAYRELGGIARIWFGRGNPERIMGEQRHITSGLLVGTLFLPWVFAWALMRPGYALGTRVFAVGWLALLTVGIILAPPLPPPDRTAGGYGAPPPAFASDSTLSDDPAVDIDPILDRFTGGQLHLAGLRNSNPRLHGQLQDAWQVASDRRESGREFYEDVMTVLRTFYREGVRAGSPGIQLAYWRLKLDQLRWVRAYGPEYCRQYLHDPDYPYRYPHDVAERAAALRNQVWASVNADPPPHRTSVMVPGDVVAEAARRAHLSLPAFRAAMRREGAPEENVCAAEIALGETALARPSAEQVRLLRELTLVE